ncbi:hypothetical protein A1O7_03285 [Cladophialophora yegresii CBS 114405]|uniref:Uncharacterized protein n=1 Tax=Cladophialophora yegresii CBS 114405 TaxID=1182544 RepID=W9WX76_9EURO|nr:uncharacterized protein A1O7_03285 [Cladophialophora yegresii CBS 114405]EXJ62844.1 hypothetical protein A1O7_03285 [Cladophialophora yegresii CBS 114405]
MKITRVSTDFFRWAPPFRFEGVGRALCQKVVRYTRAFTHITRLQESVPVRSLNRCSSPASSSRKRNPLRPVKNGGVVASSAAAWRKNKAVKAARLAKAYEALDRISPIGVDDQGFAVHLSDAVNPEWWADIDWDAIQEAEEATYRHSERHIEDCEMTDIDAVEEEGEPMDWLPSPAPYLVDQHSLVPPPHGLFSVHAQPVPEMPVCDETMVDAPASASFTTPSPPAGVDTFKQPVANEPLVEAIAPTPVPTYTPPPTIGAFVQRCFDDWHKSAVFPPTSDHALPTTTPPTSPLPFSSSTGATTHQETTINEAILETAPPPTANDDPVATVPQEYEVFIEDAKAFDVGQLKEPGPHLKQMIHASWQPDFNGNQLNSLANYPSHPWRFKLDATPNFPCPEPGHTVPRLDASRQKEMTEHYMTLWKEYP